MKMKCITGIVFFSVIFSIAAVGGDTQEGRVRKSYWAISNGFTGQILRFLHYSKTVLLFQLAAGDFLRNFCLFCQGLFQKPRLNIWRGNHAMVFLAKPAIAVSGNCLINHIPNECGDNDEPI